MMLKTSGSYSFILLYAHTGQSTLSTLTSQITPIIITTASMNRVPRVGLSFKMLDDTDGRMTSYTVANSTSDKKHKETSDNQPLYHGMQNQQQENQNNADGDFIFDDETFNEEVEVFGLSLPVNRDEKHHRGEHTQAESHADVDSHVPTDSHSSDGSISHSARIMTVSAARTIPYQTLGALALVTGSNTIYIPFNYIDEVTKIITSQQYSEVRKSRLFTRKFLSHYD